MRKITSLLMLLCMFVGTAWAQSVVSNSKVYTITPKDTTRGVMYATSTSTMLDACGGSRGGAKNPDVAVDATSPDQQFAFYTHEEQVYMYSLGASKFVGEVKNARFPLVDSPVCPVTIEDSGTEGYFVIKVNGTEVINVSTGWDVGCVGGWNSIDDGNCVAIVEAADMPDDVLAKIESCFSNKVSLVYVFKHEGVEVGRETVDAQKGAAYPQPTALCGVSFTLPEGNVPADTKDGAEVEVAVTYNEPFFVSTLTDGAFGEDMKWYHLTLRGKDVTYDAATGKVLTGNVENKTVYNLFAFTGNPFDGYSIYTYAAGADKVFWREDDTNAGRVFFTKKTETDGNTWILHANGESGYVFRLKGTENGWMNDHQPEIAIWNSGAGATDGGSTFTFTYVENPDLTVLYEVTYNFVYNKEVKYSQTVTVESGAEYPDFSLSALPYGVSVGSKPEGTVSQSGTHEIELTIEKALPFVTAQGADKISQWYYMRMHTNQPGFIGDIVDEDKTINVEWGKTAPAESLDNFTWGFVGDVFSGITVVNKGTGLQLTSTGDGNATLTESGTPFFVAATTETTPNAKYGFCMRKVDSNKYLNANYAAGKLSHWGSTDAGSTFFLTKVDKTTELEVSEIGFATLYLDYAAYIPEDVEAYVVSSVEENSAKLTQITGTLSENTGVIIKADKANYEFVASAEAPAEIEANELRGTVEDSYVNANAYVLANGTDGIALYKAMLNKDANGEAGTTHFLNNANKAYLVVEGASEARFLSFDFGTETAIESIEGAENAAKAVIYDLSGRRVQKAQKGLYIVNGVKVIK